MQIFDRRNALFRFHVFGNKLHRAWPVQRDQGNDIVELFHIELLRQTRHPSRFHLEKTNRFAAVVESERSGIIERNIFQREVWLPFANKRQRVFDHGQRFQSEEIHLKQAKIIERPHGILADHVVALHIAAKRDVIR